MIFFYEQKKTLQTIEALAFQIAYIPILFSVSFPYLCLVKILVVSSSILEKNPSLATLNYLAHMSSSILLDEVNKRMTNETIYWRNMTTFVLFMLTIFERHQMRIRLAFSTQNL